ncbi:hypothetical protein SCT_3016 [Sulfuricella sp. T08]|uniref:putative Ig domain-containing protein n=1 Tax=Sulfuricella sp. T08 TaxID=1632857 RepID=UPI0006179CC3|nr:putative Ig domain-containing protein [Sulfuricella sp. T08]GAO37580.1 hypothetical protein SCT_3016 [Sulfuricella sp. T08]
MILTLLFSSAGVWAAATPTQINDARTKGLAWLFQNQKGDGSWTALPGLEVQSTSAVLDAYMNAGIQRGNSYNAAVAKLANVQPSSVDGKARQLASLRRAGDDVTQYASKLQASGNLYKAWGSLPGYGSSPVDTSLALTALLDALPGYSNNDAFAALCGAILPAQRASGGWSYLGQGTNIPVAASDGSIIPTAYTILLLQKINTTRFTGGTCNGTSYTFSTVINNGINFLLSKQNPTDHGFGENGTSGSLETALAYLAIAAVNPAHAALVPAQDYLIATQQASGTWSNDPFQTALALQTLPVVTLADTSKDGIPDLVKTKLGITTVADGRNLLPGNGQSVAGVTASLVVANAVLNQAFNYTLQASGGTAPYTFSILSGSLPDGSPQFTLASNGVISGTPTAVGPFNFTYQVRDSLNATASVAGQILVSAAPAEAIFDTDVPTLPEWGAIVMGGLLLASMVVLDRRRNNKR